MTSPHGTHNCYAKGCRLPICREAHRRYMTWRNLDRMANGPLLIPNVGVRRRIRALGVARWTRADVGSRIGWSETNVRKLCTVPRVHRSTHEKVAALYAELENLTGTGNARTEAYARAAGGLHPADWATADIDDPDSWPEQFDTRTNSCRRGRHARCTGERLLDTELGAEPAPCSCQCHDKCA